jgi:hypothetical protein
MRRRTQSPKDEAWIDKQIACLTRQGFSTEYIMARYNVHSCRVARARREAGIISANKKFLSGAAQCNDGFAIPEMETFLTVRPRMMNFYPKVI